MHGHVFVMLCFVPTQVVSLKEESERFLFHFGESFEKCLNI